MKRVAQLNQKDLNNLVNLLIKMVWNLPYMDNESKYDTRQVMLMLDSDERAREIIDNLVNVHGEGVEEQIHNAIDRELIRREEKIFEKKRKKLESGDELEHIRDIIRGVSWETAKKRIKEMTPPVIYYMNGRQKTRYQTMKPNHILEGYIRLYIWLDTEAH